MGERSKQEIEAGDWVAEGLGEKLFLSARLALEMFRRIRELEAERDALRADAERLDFLDKWAVIRKPGEPIRAAIDRERAAIAAKEPK